jgi:acyl dehydratase
MISISEMQVGESIERVQLPPISKIDLIKYAGASGDFNPIHLFEDDAEKAGLPGIIAHGMLTMGNLAKLFTPFFEFGFIQDYRIRFAYMVFIGDMLILKADLTDQAKDTLTFKVAAENQHGKDVIKGTVKFKLY